MSSMTVSPKILIPGLMLLVMSLQAYGQQNLKPFPQHVNYSRGVIRPNHLSQKQTDESVRAFYKKWKGRYVRNDSGPGEYYIWVENSVGKDQCVSEGQGYGMMITALMAGVDTAAKTVFDGLYRYYRAHPSRNNPHLMAWAQRKSFQDVDGTSASDGDIDIAYSLLLANAQWGSNTGIDYQTEAQLIIEAIKKQEINGKTLSVLLSNAVEPDSRDYFDTRSSDFMPAHFREFGKATQDTFWTAVVDKNYRLFRYLQDTYSPDAGLVPDFIEHVNRKPVGAKPHYLESKFDGVYNYNACRVPWRIATDYLLNGDPRALTFVKKINQWIKATCQNIPDNISAGYTLGGDDLRGRNYEAMSFVASFAIAAMVDRSNQEWLNQLWDYMMGFRLDAFDYYDNTIKMIGLILLSGNYWTP
jgi:endo-1,4-beta-D-glucanase Y